MKCFYTIEQTSAADKYEIPILLANHTKGLHVLLENRFAASLGITDPLYSIDTAKRDVFELILSDNGFTFERLMVDDEYNNWVNSLYCKNEELEDEFLNHTDVFLIREFFVPRILEGIDGNQIITEEEVKRKDNIRIYTHSNENCGHHIPHVHVKYGDKKNYCVISLTDCSVIEPQKKQGAKIRKCMELLNTCIDDARLAWNRTSGLQKFVIDETGKPTNMLE